MTQAETVTNKDRLMLAAADLFLRHGFGPVGLDQIIAAVGVTKTTFYKHFESKDDLIVQVLGNQHKLEMRQLLDATRELAGEDPVKQVVAVFDVLDQWFSQHDFQGCIFLKAAT